MMSKKMYSEKIKVTHTINGVKNEICEFNEA